MVPLESRPQAPRAGVSPDEQEARVRALLACIREYLGGEAPCAHTQLSDLPLDSLDLLELLFELEQHSGRTLGNRDLAALGTVGDVMRYFGIPVDQALRERWDGTR